MYNNVRHICHGGEGGVYSLVALHPGEYLVGLRGTSKWVIQSVNKILYFCPHQGGYVFCGVCLSVCKII